MSRLIPATGRLVLFGALALAGCQAMKPSTDSETLLGTARISSGVLQGQRLNIPQSGLSLDEAIASAQRPGAQNVRTEDGADLVLDQWVAIRRGNHRFFVPLFLVQHSVAGSIQLLPGDLVDVVPSNRVGTIAGVEPAKAPGLFHTPDPQDVDVPHSFVVTGLSTETGVKSTADLKVKQGAARTVNAIGGKKALGEPGSSFSIQASIIVLTRTVGSITDQYILPLDGERDFGINEDFGRSKAVIREGDHVHYTRLEFLSLVRSGVRQAARSKELARQQAGSGGQRHLAELHERLDEGDGPIGGLHRLAGGVQQRISQIPRPALP